MEHPERDEPDEVAEDVEDLDLQVEEAEDVKGGTARPGSGGGTRQGGGGPGG